MWNIRWTTIYLLSDGRYLFLWQWVCRLILACAFCYMGIQVGAGYIHVRVAGSKLLEGFAAIGSGSIPLVSIVRIRKFRYTLPVAGGIILISYLLRNLYLNWIHGPYNP